MRCRRRIDEEESTIKRIDGKSSEISMGHTHGRTGAALFVPAPPRLGGASNLLENQINLAAGCKTLSLASSFFLRFYPTAFPLPLVAYLSHSLLSLSLSPLPLCLLLSSSSLGISRTRANRRHGTEMEAKKEVGRRSSVPPTRTQRREEKVAQQQRALDFWLWPLQGRSHSTLRNIRTSSVYSHFKTM